MTWLLRHNFWIVKLVGLVTVTAIIANTATTLVAFYLLSAGRADAPVTTDEGEDDDDDAAGGPEAALAAGPSLDRARQAERAAERILGHSPFCPTCAPTPPAEPDDGGMSVDAGADDDLSRARRSQLPLVVAATMEHLDPSRSLATLVDTQRGVGGLFSVGDPLGDQVEILRIAPGRVHIVNHGVLEYIPFEGLPDPPPGAATPAATAPAAVAVAKKNSRAIEGAQDAIACSDKGDCVVERAFVEKLFADPKLLMGQGGASPATTKDGAPGFRLRGVGQGTLPDLLGLRNGDVITEVGGSPLTMDAVAGLYGKLRHASHVEVTVDRRGERMRKQLEIRS